MTQPDDAWRWRAAALVVSIFVGASAAWLFAPVVHGYFLSDDFVAFALFRHWQEEGTLFSHLLEKFHLAIDAGNNFYRPLAYLLLGVSYVSGGVDPSAWMYVNVAIHVINGMLVGVLGAMLVAERPGAREIAAGVMGGALFMFFAPDAEVVAWISGHYDALATFFVLYACIMFVRSRRALDVPWWLSLFSAAAAFMSKESAAIVPFAMVLLAAVKPAALEAPSPVARWSIAIRGAAPWLVLAALYLAWRQVLFGSFTQVYGGSEPVAVVLHGEYWQLVANTLPQWLAAQFQPGYRIPFFVGLIALQLAIIAFALPREGRGREAIISAAGIVALSILLLLPHVGGLPPDGLGGRLLYQGAAFYGVLVTIALCHVRLPYLAWGSTLALVILDVGFMHGAIARWDSAYSQMRALVEEVRDLASSQPPGEYTLVVAPAVLDGVPFARNAQAGLMLPPVMHDPISSRVLVQVDEELDDLPGKIVDGVVTTLRMRSVFDYLAGVRIHPYVPEYPTRVVCWDPGARRLFTITVRPEASGPGEWGLAVRAGLRASPCTNHVLPRR